MEATEEKAGIIPAQQATALKWQPVESSNLSDVYYQPETQTLFVRFTDLAVYSYEHVPQATYDALMAAPSKGQYFHQHIKGKFETLKIASGVRREK